MAVANIRAGWVLARPLFHRPNLYPSTLNYIKSRIVATNCVIPESYSRKKSIRICATYNNFGSLSGHSFASCHKAQDLMCQVVLLTAGRHWSVRLWHMHADMFKCGICDITKSLSVWFCSESESSLPRNRYIFFFGHFLAKNGLRSDSKRPVLKIFPGEHSPRLF